MCNTHSFSRYSLTILQNTNFELYGALLASTDIETKKWDQALLNVQITLLEGNIFLDTDFQIKEHCHVRFTNLPTTDTGYRTLFPSEEQVGQFVQIKGNVVRMTQAKLLEYKRDYVCTRCHQTTTVTGKYNKFYTIESPRSCGTTNGDAHCRGVPRPKLGQLNTKYCKDFQEVRVQELLSDKNMPASMVVTLENDLVNSCQPGDRVTIW